MVVKEATTFMIKEGWLSIKDMRERKERFYELLSLRAQEQRTKGDDDVAVNVVDDDGDEFERRRTRMSQCRRARRRTMRLD
jgi:hypothetical protein